MSLLCLYVVFVVAGLVTAVEPLCGLVAALFHYIMLVFFGWTAAEAVFLYHKLAVVLETQYTTMSGRLDLQFGVSKMN